MKNIVHTFDPKRYGHRANFTNCPDCDFFMESEDWDKAAVTLALAEVHGKHGSAVILSECPKCHEKSWVHHGLDSFYDFQPWPKSWIAAASKEWDKRHHASIVELAGSLCIRCAHVQKIDLKTTPRITCPGRSGGCAYTCDKFKARSNK